MILNKLIAGIVGTSGFLFAAATPVLADYVATFRGHGTVKHDVEQAQIVINVHAKCFRSSVQAYDAANGIVSQVIANLEPRLNRQNEQDRLIHEGISTTEYSTYDPRSQTNICENTYQAQGTVVLRTSDLTNFGRTVAEIQNSLLSLAQLSGDISKESVSITISNPIKTVYPETMQKLHLQAASLAKSNAEDLFGTVCPGVQYSIVAISDPRLTRARVYEPKSMAGMQMEARSMSSVGSDPSPILFSQVEMNYELDVTFNFVGECVAEQK